MSEDFVPLEAVLGSYNPLRLHMRLGGPQEQYTSEHQTVEAQATMVHEHFHFLQTLFTGYGHWLWDAHRQLTSWIIEQWREFPRAQGEEWRLPLAHQAKVSPVHEQRAVMAGWTAEDWLKRIGARYWIRTPDATLEQLGIMVNPQPWPANPTVSVVGSTHTLQTRELIEGHAFFVEATFQERLRGVPKDVAWDRGARPSLYWIGLQYFLETCGEVRRTEFPFVCDLALQTSWSPVVPQTEAEWRELNPAWRFVRLVEALRDDPSLELGPPETHAETYSEFASALLGRCGYRALEEVGAERLEVLARKPQMLPTEALMKAAIAWRLRYPWCLGNPTLDENLLLTMMHGFPVPLIEVEGRLGSYGKLPAELGGEMVMELQYQALAEQLLGYWSAAARNEGAVECGFEKYEIKNGCEYQRDCACPGRYRPQDGTPHPVRVLEDGNTLSGCYFEMLLMQMQISSTDLDVDPTARLPTQAEIQARQQPTA